MNFSGIIIGAATFLCIGMFHPIVIKAEYHFGVELKAGFGLLSPDTGGTDHTNPFYFHGGPTFGIGINIEA